ncbi:MAG: DUF3696 domain-containing protein [Leptospiraceae bacterium]|nr:DUF3696 domain-containing protein [Leptospiraceae bacterium]
MSILKSMHIENFKAYRSTDIKFAPLTVLVGANSAGKSSLIQSLLLSRRAILDKTSNNESSVKLNNKIENYIELGNTEEIFHFRKGVENRKTKKGKSNDDHILFKMLNSEKQILEINSTSFKDTDVSLTIDFENIKISKDNNLNLLSHNFHYLNSERIGPRSFFSMKGNIETNVGFQGEYTSDVLWTISSRAKEYSIQEGKKWISDYDESINTVSSEDMLRHIQAWFQFLFPNSELRVIPHRDMNTVQLSLRKGNLETFLNPNNMGFGLSYSLPVLVTGVAAKEKELFIVENPEAHLHPKSQSRMGQFLAKMAGTGTQTIIETHSEHIVNGICLGIVKGFIKPKDVLINYFDQENGKMKITEIRIDKEGNFDQWPDGFFDQTLKDLSEINTRRNKK